MGRRPDASVPIEPGPPLPEPVAFFLTWHTYGTWLPGDERGWKPRGRGRMPADPVRESEARAVMRETPCVLDCEQRALVERTIEDHCRTRAWALYAVNCRSNHVHVVVAAREHPKEVRKEMKAWATRRLKELEQQRQQSGEAMVPIRQRWWSERGTGLFVRDEAGLQAVVQYVIDAQDGPREG